MDQSFSVAAFWDCHGSTKNQVRSDGIPVIPVWLSSMNHDCLEHAKTGPNKILKICYGQLSMRQCPQPYPSACAC